MTDLLDAYLAEYNGLWAEINTRLQIREGLLSTGATVVIAALSIGLLGIYGRTPAPQLAWREALLAVPLLALAFQAMQLRHFVRIATISMYRLVDLAERVEASLQHKPPPETGPFGWSPFLHRGIMTGPERAEWLLGPVELVMFPVLGLVGPVVYVLSRQTCEGLTYAAGLEILVLGASIWYAVRVRRRFVERQVVFTSPERIVAAYYEALAKGTWHLLGYMLPREKRASATIGRSPVEIDLQALSLRHDAQTGETVATVTGQRRVGRRDKAKYRAALTLVPRVGRWYIVDVREEATPD